MSHGPGRQMIGVGEPAQVGAAFSQDHFPDAPANPRNGAQLLRLSYFVMGLTH